MWCRCGIVLMLLWCCGIVVVPFYSDIATTTTPQQSTTLNRRIVVVVLLWRCCNVVRIELGEGCHLWATVHWPEFMTWVLVTRFFLGQK